MNFRWEDGRFRRTAMLVLALIAIVLTVHEIFGGHGYLALRRRRQELQTLQEQVRQLQEENQKLEQQIKALKTDPKAIEKLAREQMKLRFVAHSVAALRSEVCQPIPSVLESNQQGL
ncbi:MAG: septum formation initiator family protein [Acidobacteriia bacterium]|nr:septum formation initiator family protein [Terriglobia bacterium]